MRYLIPLWLCLPFLIALNRPGFADDKAERPAFSPAELEFFEKEVRPLLVKRCYECHSADTKEPKGGLRLDSRAGVLKGGDTGAAAVVKQPAKSLLVDAINYGDLYQMPPKSKLADAEIAVLTRWVELGLPWPAGDAVAAASHDTFDLAARKADHWCWQPLAPPKPPEVKAASWPTRDLDYFILAKLEGAGLTPAASADKRTLLRRAYFDLIGLPPSPAEVDAFLADDSPKAFERVVDTLLDSPHFGERWARHWMDLVRYAETYGHEFDYPVPHAYKYRDYLIRAFNADVPYDQFIIEHIAGDLMANPRMHSEQQFNESVIATGFWWLGEATHAPVDVRGDEAGRIDNQLDVMGKSFLGLTIACARCHDHKFDAISTKDYYALAGFLQSSRRDEPFLDPGGRVRDGIEKLAAAKQQADLALRNAASSVGLSGDDFARYLQASREAIHGEAKPSDSEHTSDDVLFEDFESELYEGWTAEGTAFGSGPRTKELTPDYQGEIGAQGKRWVNSHKTDSEPKGDRHTGTLTSDPFQIEHKFVRFLVGGGGHAGKTCVNLLIDDKVVRTQPGFNQNRMQPARFDVTEFVGKNARIQIVDQEKGGWGNIGVDHIVFSDSPRPLSRPLHVVTREFDVDAKQLERWIVALAAPQAARNDHPLFFWATVDAGTTADKLQVIERQQATNEEDYVVLADFNTGYDGWFTSGHAFGSGPARTATSRLSGEQLELATPGAADSGQLGTRAQGVLRSPTFELTHGNIWYRVRGQGVKVRLILEGYFMDVYNGLLFRGFSFDLNGDGQMNWQRQAGDLHRYVGHKAYIEILDHGHGSAAIDQIVLSNSPRMPAEVNSVAAAIALAKTDTPEDLASAYGDIWTTAVAAWQSGKADGAHAELINWALRQGLVDFDEDASAALSASAQQLKDLNASLPRPDRVLGMADGTPENERVFIRGNHRTLGDEASRQLLVALRDDEPFEPVGSGRLQLAREIADPDNPLTSRVMANRVWHHLFGRGIVGSVDNFGVLGQTPTHPQLLDHLAREFTRDGWSIKRLIRSIMLSSTYRMSSEPNAAATEVDPQNLLLHRMRIRRLQGEVIRDSILAISGRLDRKRFGPGVAPHLTPYMQGRGRPRGGPLDGNGRRSVYLQVRRNFLSPMMLAFDTPIPFNSVGRRNLSNVPAQALILMNDPLVVEQSKLWARRLIADFDSPESRVHQMYVAAFARPPSDSELENATAFVRQQAVELGLPDGEGVNDERIWSDLCHVLMNVKEFVFLK